MLLKNPFENSMGKRENGGNQDLFSFQQQFLSYHRQKPFFIYI